VTQFDSNLRRAEIPHLSEAIARNGNLPLARIAFAFNRHDYGRLMQLIGVVMGIIGGVLT
jgi:hypothetical protein